MIIIHRCINCGHAEHEHRPDTADTLVCRFGGDACPTGRSGPHIMGPPEVIPTFDGNGKVVERILTPGSGILSQTGQVIIKGCDCEDCAALYEAAS